MGYLAVLSNFTDFILTTDVRFIKSEAFFTLNTPPNMGFLFVVPRIQKRLYCLKDEVVCSSKTSVSGDKSTRRCRKTTIYSFSAVTVSNLEEAIAAIWFTFLKSSLASHIIHPVVIKCDSFGIGEI
jgi:hypothetical protein